MIELQPYNYNDNSDTVKSGDSYTETIVSFYWDVTLVSVFLLGCDPDLQKVVTLLQPIYPNHSFFIHRLKHIKIMVVS